MKLSDKIQMAFTDLMNRKVRTFLTVIAISIGSLLIIMMMGIGDGVTNNIKDMFENIGDKNVINVYPIDTDKVNDAAKNADSSIIQEATDDKAEDTSKKISKDDISNFKDIDGVDKVKASIEGNATAIKLGDCDYVEKKVKVIGISFDFSHNYSDDIVAGNDLKNEDDDVLVSESFVKKLGLSDAEDLVGKKITIKTEYPAINGMQVKEPKEVTGTVVGVLNKKNYSSSVVMSDKKANPIAGYYSNDEDYISNKGYSGVSVYVKDGANIAKINSTISKDYGYQTFYLEMINNVVETLGTVIKSVLSVAGLIVLVVAALGLVNTIGMILQEKRKMIGVMRSIGSSKGNVRIIFLFQSIILGICGAILGIALSALGTFIINEFIIDSSSFKIALTSNNIVFSSVATILISIVAGLIPASRAAKLNVVEAVAEE